MVSSGVNSRSNGEGDGRERGGVRPPARKRVPKPQSPSSRRKTRRRASV